MLGQKYDDTKYPEPVLEKWPLRNGVAVVIATSLAAWFVFAVTFAAIFG
jgi:hypothetical protein